MSESIKAVTQNTNTKMALMAQDIGYIRDKIDEVAQSSINREQFTNLETRVSLLEKIVYGFVGLILVSVVVAILALVIHSNPSGAR